MLVSIDNKLNWKAELGDIAKLHLLKPMQCL